uniref:Penicillin-binding 1 transmembrane protein MrcA n=1 Tax=Nitrosomonas europaea (strain ATCC 19718 / CIP 103999 / KCTC 2705 / NBRC 14298) TaxID=228410 RepID=UPI000178D70A
SNAYRGPEAFLKLPKDLKDREALQDIMQDIGNSDDILAAVVLSATPGAVEAFRKNGETIRITGDGLKAAHRFLSNDPKIGEKRIRPGALIRVKKTEKGSWQIVQLP